MVASAVNIVKSKTAYFDIMESRYGCLGRWIGSRYACLDILDLDKSRYACLGIVDLDKSKDMSEPQEITMTCLPP